MCEVDEVGLIMQTNMEGSLKRVTRYYNISSNIHSPHMCMCRATDTWYDGSAW